MAHKFHRLSTDSAFPHIDNIDVYKYDNDFDYSRFNYDQMDLLICSVPWDMGEAHVGNRTISGIGNVVYFGSKAERDAWFDAIPNDECYRFTTKFKELHREHIIDVEIPYDMCAKHNYLKVHYNLFANDDSPVKFEGEDGLRDWFWFIREVEFIAPNTTRLHLLDDAFQTWIYDVDITGMVLERGHAPMFDMRASRYLQNPIQNNTYLLTEDVNYGEAAQVSHIDVLALNGDTMYACVATTASPTSAWGSKANSDWKVPALTYNDIDGVPSVKVFAVATSDLDALLSRLDASIPQFKQTIQAVFFVPANLVTVTGSFTFGNVTCYWLSSNRKTFDLSDINKADFDYPTEYADIAKLYTYPYAHIEICDENGDTSIVRIEDTEGKIQVNVALSLAYPFLNIDAHLMGVGGRANTSVTFRNIDAKTFPISGKWYDHLQSWSIPTFAVVQQASVNNDFATYFDRAQRVVDYTAEYDNAAQNASTTTANATATTTANTAVSNYSILSANREYDKTRDYNNEINDADNLATDAMAQSSIAANEMQAAIASSAAMATGALGTISSPSNLLNPLGVAASVMSANVGMNATYANTAVAAQLESNNSQTAQAINTAHTSQANSLAHEKYTILRETTEGVRDANNTATTTIAANNAGAILANAGRTQSAAQSAIDNDVAQAALREPYRYGVAANGESAVTKPMALFAHVVTQSRSAVASAGDEFLRYGYMLDRYWNFDGNWNIGPYFTYWKLRDFWVTNLNVPDMYMDKLRFFLFGGVTIWRKPEYIGRVSIYDNFV